LTGIIYFGLLQYFRDRKIIKAASRRLNQFCVLGCVTAYTALIVYGLDEAQIKDKVSLDFLCNMRFWLLIISITLSIGPLVLKTYRIYQIFIQAPKTLLEVDLPDRRLIVLLGYAVLADVFILTIVTVITPLRRERNFDHDQVEDPITVTRYKYGDCTQDQLWRYVFFYGCVAVYKGLGILVGIYYAVSVWNIERRSHNESANVLFTLFINSSLLLIITPITFISIPGQIGVNFRYSVLVFGVLVGTLIGLNILYAPRFYALYKNKEIEYIEQTLMEGICKGMELDLDDRQFQALDLDRDTYNRVRHRSINSLKIRRLSSMKYKHTWEEHVPEKDRALVDQTEMQKTPTDGNDHDGQKVTKGGDARKHREGSPIVSVASVSHESHEEREEP